MFFPVVDGSKEVSLEVIVSCIFWATKQALYFAGFAVVFRHHIKLLMGKTGNISVLEE